MRLLNNGLLLLIAVLLAGGNLWISAARSTIPLSLDDTVDEVELRTEKHPGNDDVYLLHLASGRSMQIDRAVAASLAPRAVIKKQSWSRDLGLDDRIVELSWSQDVRGMTIVMPAILLILLATEACVCLSQPGAAPPSKGQ